MGRNILLVGFGSMLGGIARYLVTLLAAQYSSSGFYYGTFAANITGCFLIGMVAGMAERFEFISPELRLFLAVGICGGYTTFSSFAYENILLLQQKDYAVFFIYTAASIIVGLTAVLAGLWLTR